VLRINAFRGGRVGETEIHGPLKIPGKTAIWSAIKFRKVQFNMVNRWVPAWRYTADLSNPDDAKDFLDAVEKFSHWIEHNI
jgi:hypothetical protein